MRLVKEFRNSTGSPGYPKFHLLTLVCDKQVTIEMLKFRKGGWVMWANLGMRPGTQPSLSRQWNGSITFNYVKQKHHFTVVIVI